eukprot:202788_1
MHQRVRSPHTRSIQTNLFTSQSDDETPPNTHDTEAKREASIETSDRHMQNKRRAKHRRRKRRNNDNHARSRTADIADVIIADNLFTNDDDDAPGEPTPPSNHSRRHRHNKARRPQVPDIHFRSQTSVKDLANQLNNMINEEMVEKEKEAEVIRARRRPKRIKKRPNSATFADKDKTNQSFFPSNPTDDTPLTPNQRFKPPPPPRSRPRPKKKTKEDIARTFKQNSNKKARAKRKIKRPSSATFRKSSDNSTSERSFFGSNDDATVQDKLDYMNKKSSHKKSFFGFTSSPLTPRRKKKRSKKNSIAVAMDDDEEPGPSMSVPRPKLGRSDSTPSSNVSSELTAKLQLRVDTKTAPPPKPKTACGYIESLPTSPENHGWIYHARYGPVVFTYDEAQQTARAIRRATYRESIYTQPHLGLPTPVSPVKDTAEDSKEKDDIDGISDIDRLFVYQPVEFEITYEPDKNENIACDIDKDEETRKVVIAKLQNYHKGKNIKKRTKSNRGTEEKDKEEDRLNGIRNGFISERRTRTPVDWVADESTCVMPDVATRTRAGHADSDAVAHAIPTPHKKGSSLPKVKANTPSKTVAYSVPKAAFSGPPDRVKKIHITESKSVSIEGDDDTQDDTVNAHKHKRNKYKRPKGLVLDDGDANITRSSNHVITKPLPDSKRNAMSNKTKTRKRNALSDTLNVARLRKLNQQRLKKKQRRMIAKSSADQTKIAPNDDSVIAHSNSLTLTPSVSTLAGKNRQKIATNVRTKDQIHDDNVSLYCFTPKGKHYMKMGLDHGSSAASHGIDTPTSAPVKLEIIKSGPKKIRRAKSSRKLKKQHSFDLRNYMRNKTSASKSFDKCIKQKQTQFCPSSSQYYVRDSCLLHWEGKSIGNIDQDGAKKIETSRLGLGEEKKSKQDSKARSDLFFSMETDVDSIIDELEEKINRLFNNEGGTIYVGVNELELEDNEELHKGHPKAGSFSLTRKKMMKHKHNKASVKAKIPLSIRSRIICGIELSSKMRFELKHRIVDEIVKGFTPQVPRLLNNFFLKFIPVVSQEGKLVQSVFVIKVSVFAPILGDNGEKLSFRTKDGYSYIVDFDF